MATLERAIDANAGIVLLPELSTSPDIAQAVRARLRSDDGPRLVVCGSWHQSDPATGAAENVSVGLVAGARSEMVHRKLAQFGNLYPSVPETRSREGIVRPNPPLVRIYVADAYRFALTICKDYLDDTVAAALDRVGANVLLVPAMSEKTQPFKSYAHAHVARAQAVSLIANGPLEWDGEAVLPSARLVRPYAPVDSVELHPGSTPATVLISLRDGTATIVSR